MSARNKPHPGDPASRKPHPEEPAKPASRRTRSLAAFLTALAVLFAAPAHAQITGTVDWASLGFADEAAIVTGTTTVSAGVTTTITWSTVTDGGTFIPYEGADFVSYESGTQGGFTGYAQVGFDNGNRDDDDKVTIELTFSEAVTDLEFTMTDIDQSSWDDFVEIFYNTGSTWVNAKTGAFETMGPTVGRDDETFGDGWEGLSSASNTSSDGNLAFDFATTQITAIRIIYFSGNDGSSNPGSQQLGISDVTFDKIMPLLSALKTVAMVGTSGNSRFAIPGNDVYYTLTVTNSGDGAVDTNTLFLVDPIPSEVEFFNGDIDGGGPATGAVYFTQAGAGLTFTLATDVRYSNAGSAPASFAACTYTPAAGYDPNVRYLCLNPKGRMVGGAPDPTFSAQFRARVK